MACLFHTLIRIAEKEMLRDNCKTQPIYFETPEGLRQAGGKGGKEATRRRFPQVSADLTVRWCSAYLKIDVAAIAINNQERFYKGRTLFITGERAQESAARAKYATLEPHRTDNRNGTKKPKHVDHWRPVHGWDEAEVWAIIERHRVNPPPAYHLGFGRLSCMTCIFSSENQLASVRAIDPDRLRLIADYELDFGVTIHRTKSVLERAAAGTSYDMGKDMIRLAMSEAYDAAVIVPPGQEWKLPAGAFGEAAGPC